MWRFLKLVLLATWVRTMRWHVKRVRLSCNGRDPFSPPVLEAKVAVFYKGRNSSNHLDVLDRSQSTAHTAASVQTASKWWENNG